MWWGWTRQGRYTEFVFILGWVACVCGGVFLGLFAISHIAPKLFAERVSAAPGIDASATCYGRAEYVRVLPIVIPELKLGNVERHVLGADLVERADNSALQDRPKAFNGVRVDCADHILLAV